MTDRNVKLRENYRRLREAGFSTDEATRYRGASEEAISKVILEKKLPEIIEEQALKRRGKGAEKILFNYKELMKGEFNYDAHDSFIEFSVNNYSEEELQEYFCQLLRELEEAFKEKKEKIFKKKKTPSLVTVNIVKTKESKKKISRYYGDKHIYSYNRKTQKRYILAEIMYILENVLNPEENLRAFYNLLPEIVEACERR